VSLTRPQKPHRLAARLETFAGSFTARLRQEFAHEIAHDPKAFKASVLRLIRRGLPPRRGRPNDPRI